MRLAPGLFTLALLTASAAAQTSRPGDVVARLDEYIERYEGQLAHVVAEETYRQWVEQGPVDRGKTMMRVLRSDFALTRTEQGWAGYRDTFEVDGVPVRDREERLRDLLQGGAVAQAARIAAQNARFNLGDGVITRNINVPTFALEMMGRRVRDRFRVRRTGTQLLDGRPGWSVEFRERGRPTLVRTPEGRDQASRIVALVDVETGRLRRTTITWERLDGSVTVDYGDAGLPFAVPVRMVERYVARDGAVVGGEAAYANYRQFETSARLVR